MYYPDLKTLSCYRVMSTFINEFDTWLAALPDSSKDRITIDSISNTFGIPYDIVMAILEESCKIGVLDTVYAITCPTCEFILKITDSKHLLEEMSVQTCCYECGAEELEISAENVYTMYKLIKAPDRPYIIKQSNTIHKAMLSSSSSIDKLLKQDPSKINSFFFAPDANEYKNLEQLFKALDNDYGKNTTAKGAALDKFISYLFEIVPSFTASTKLRKKKNVNQIDCCVKNICGLNHSMFDVMGPVFIMECKNENSVPGNTYFNKLVSIMDSMGIKFGMIISRIKWADTCDELAWEKYLKHGIEVINLYDADYKSIIYDKKNLLDIVHNKHIDLVTHSNKQLFK